MEETVVEVLQRPWLLGLLAELLHHGETETLLGVWRSRSNVDKTFQTGRVVERAWNVGCRLA